jgi:hypothetical protein
MVGWNSRIFSIVQTHVLNRTIGNDFQRFDIEFIKGIFYLPRNQNLISMYAVVRHYHFKPEDGTLIDKMVREGFVPLIKKAKGFVRYYWLDKGNGEGASFSVFKNKAGADESITLAADFVHEHLSKYITQKPEIVEGPVAAHD